MQKYNILELNEKLLPELQSIAEELGIKKVSSLKKEELVYRILDEQAISYAGIQAEKEKEKEAKKAENKNTQPTTVTPATVTKTSTVTGSAVAATSTAAATGTIASVASNAVKTGDPSQAGLFMSLLAGSTGTLEALRRRRKNRKKSQN